MNEFDLNDENLCDHFSAQIIYFISRQLSLNLSYPNIHYLVLATSF